MTGFSRPDDPFVASLAPQYEVVERGEGWAIYQQREPAPAAN